NADGTWSLEAYPVPVHYQDAQGKWQNIDTNVAADSSQSGYDYAAKANSWQAYFARQAGGKNLLQVNYPDLTVAEALSGAASSTATVSGSRVTYANVFSGVNLQYAVGNAHLEETLLLHDAKGPQSYTFAYHVPGVTAKQDDAGNIVFS